MASTRPVTQEDLTAEQRRLYDALPQTLRPLFLQELPPLKLDTGRAKRFLTWAEPRLAQVDALLVALQAYRESLAVAIGLAKLGKNLPALQPLRTLPAVPGLRVWVVRPKRGAK